MKKELELEIYYCAGCDGEVSVVEAMWLPEKPINKRHEAQPFCSQECYEFHSPNKGE